MPLAYYRQVQNPTMKNLYLVFALTFATCSAFSQIYTISTAKNSGDWSDLNNWTIVVRQDNKKVHDVIIPVNITISLDFNYDATSLGNVNILIAGKLEIPMDKTLALNNNSKIALVNGTIELDATAKKNKKKKKEQIKIGNVAKFDGALETVVTGNVYADQVTGTSPFGFSFNSILPVNFVSFNVSKVNNSSIAINWSTSDEVNNSHFEIQRSTDGVNWSSIAIVVPFEDASIAHLYKYQDKFSFNGAIYYRIRQVDFDGKSTYSNVKMIGDAKPDMQAQIYVSASKTVTIDLENSTEGNVTIRLISMNGMVVNKKITNQAGQKISLNAYNALSGAYVVQVTDSKGKFTSKKILL